MNEIVQKQMNCKELMFFGSTLERPIDKPMSMIKPLNLAICAQNYHTRRFQNYEIFIFRGCAVCKRNNIESILLANPPHGPHHCLLFF